MSVIGSNILAGASGQGGEYTLARSLRFRSDASANLYKNISTTATDRKKFTYSTWVKLGNLGTGVQVVANHTGDDWIYFVNNKLYFEFTGAILVTTQVFRDPSAWYHIMCVCDTTQATSTDRMKIYVNGSQVTSFTSNTPPALNYQSTFMTTGNNYIGCYNGSFYFFDGYMAETHHIDGQALTPSSFGQTSPTTGVWQPKKYAGTYGTNGFYLPFTNNSTTTTLGNDFSGNGNNWTANNISLTAGATYDSMTDVPTLTSATVANYCVLNPLDATSGTSITNGNLNVTTATDNFGLTKGTIWVSSGKWYWEITVNGTTSATLNADIGITNGTETYVGQVGGYGYASSSGSKVNSGVSEAYGASYTTNDIIGVAFDSTAGTITFYKNGVSQGQAYSGISGLFTPAVSDLNVDRGTLYTANFGQRPFAYTPPTGFVALNTFNLPTPTIGATASTQANKYFDATLYTGTGSALTVTNAGSMQPDLVWIKSRSSVTNNNLTDSIRGVDKILFSNSANGEATFSGGLSSFNSNGFSLATGGDSGFSANGSTYVGWQWKANGTGVSNTAGSITSTVSANTSSGFSVVTYTLNNSTFTVGHGLGVAPKMIIVKNRDAGNNWDVYHSATGAGVRLQLNSTAGSQSSTQVWNNTAPTSTVFSGDSAWWTNPSTSRLVAYCFAEVAGYSKFSSYAGTGSTNFIYTGFKPKFIMIKVTTSAGRWEMFDISRSPYNPSNSRLAANESSAEVTNYASPDFLSNGFKLNSAVGYTNDSGQTYLYMAFAENPFKYSLAQ